MILIPGELSDPEFPGVFFLVDSLPCLIISAAKGSYKVMTLNFELQISQNYINFSSNLYGKLDILFLPVLLIKRTVITGPSNTKV